MRVVSHCEFFHESSSGWRVCLEDDDRVAYAYLLAPGGGITSDVWLYNVATAPVRGAWIELDRTRAVEAMPFLNPQSYVRDSAATRLEQAEQIDVSWFRADARQGADIFLDGHFYGRVLDGQKPGWAQLARCSGPLALAVD